MRIEKSSCGVGFVASRRGAAERGVVEAALHALRCVEHRGACAADGRTSDGAGLMTDLPHALFGYLPESVAVAFLFLPSDPSRSAQAFDVLADTFDFHDLHVLESRDVPTNPTVLGPVARQLLPTLKQAVIKRPSQARTLATFERLLYVAKQMTRKQWRKRGLDASCFFASLSATTIVYKALTQAADLSRFYLDLQHPAFVSRFALFHRRFSTNTRTAWDRAQPFRLIAHNGEINTIAGNRAWAHSRERSLGLEAGELLTHGGISDTGSLNEMIEALRYRSGVLSLAEALAIVMPPAESDPYHAFWGRALEPWDGPAIVAFADGQVVGARLDRNGFRPGRWVETNDVFCLASEAGAFAIDEAQTRAKGALHAGTGVVVDLRSGNVSFIEPRAQAKVAGAVFDARARRLPESPAPNAPTAARQARAFGYAYDDIQFALAPMAATGKEPLGSMGDTARLAVLSDLPRPLFDFFYQDFAQVTNPPVDYLREALVMDTKVYLGAKPNIFAPKTLVPMPPAIELDGPVLSLSALASLRAALGTTRLGVHVAELDATFAVADGARGLRAALAELQRQALNLAEHGASALLVSDGKVSATRAPIPSLLALRAIVNGLNESGMLLDAALVLDTGEARAAHHVAALISFGAAAVCPRVALDCARFGRHPKLDDLPPDAREANLIKALTGGVLKIMAKMGISVLASYQNAQLFTPIGLGPKLLDEFFPGKESCLGGLELDDLAQRQLEIHASWLRAEADGSDALDLRGLPRYFRFKEDTQGAYGERHSMTTGRARVVHAFVRSAEPLPERYAEYVTLGAESEPVSPRHLLTIRSDVAPLSLEAVQPRAAILKAFGTGGMSFGAISAESQRDLILAMRKLGGRSNSGEGGENPYYFESGVTATIKQIGSARFGVTARYLVTGDEIQIKIAQGAKPGEGGQLMRHKVTPEIARARHATPDMDLISPPPMHDIYSIEDLKQLVEELKSLRPQARVSVKLVAGANVGTIAVGVAKSGADVIHIAGGDGGTGAAGLASMAHAGLPWEIGLAEAHRALCEEGLRGDVTLRVDGGLSTGLDVVLASVLGAEEFDFGKLALIAEGCIMARICETNQCPAGIATHDPKRKAKYAGDPNQVARLFEAIADDARQWLAKAGLPTLTAAIGRTDLLAPNPRHAERIAERRLDLSFFLAPPLPLPPPVGRAPFRVGELNERLLNDARASLLAGQAAYDGDYAITSFDRAVPATLAGWLARAAHEREFKSERESESGAAFIVNEPSVTLRFTGSAGQGFGVFLTDGIRLGLRGEANDSVGKGMSGGKIVIRPHPAWRDEAETNALIGNAALYGATGGTLYVGGFAGDRFAVRNSGATAVVHGVGLHACEYMTGGQVVILGPTSKNLGAGMTGGRIYIFGGAPATHVNWNFLAERTPTPDELAALRALLTDFMVEIESRAVGLLLEQWATSARQFVLYVPRPPDA
ncbi:MAG: glutamate synthase large subunit [Chloracidobacterium sp. CP2_5A]|nr:MAG: glutamate synthase large subunit [Chloracidobacterium sp. CP2_5A]